MFGKIIKLARYLYPRPFGIGRLPRGSAIMLPRKIEGASRISVGSNTLVAKNGWIAAYSNYKGQRFAPQIVIGANVRIGENAVITAIDSVEIEERHPEFLGRRNRDVTGAGHAV